LAVTQVKAAERMAKADEVTEMGGSPDGKISFDEFLTLLSLGSDGKDGPQGADPKGKAEDAVR
jgi:hypothetical protein